MSEWSEQLTSRLGTALRERRLALDLTAQAVADRCAEAGHPVSRTTITDYELGRRKDRVLVGDVIALAAALRIPAAQLLYPFSDKEVEAAPGVTVDTLKAHQSLTGVAGTHLPIGEESEWTHHTGKYDARVQLERMKEALREFQLEEETATDPKRVMVLRELIANQTEAVNEQKLKIAALDGRDYLG